MSLRRCVDPRCAELTPPDEAVGRGIEAGGGDEIGILVNSFNQMTGSIEDLLRQVRALDMEDVRTRYAEQLAQREAQQTG